MKEDIRNLDDARRLKAETAQLILQRRPGPLRWFLRKVHQLSSLVERESLRNLRGE